MEQLIKIRNAFNDVTYRQMIKRVCFLFDPEKVHHVFLETGKLIGKNEGLKKITRTLYNYQHKMLEQKLKGIDFKNPVGLSAGFDKNAELIEVLPEVGFGFMEVGSITALSCEGNKGKRLMRLPDKKALWVNFGLNNRGAEEISSRLKTLKFRIPVAISVAKTNCKETADPVKGAKDYVQTLKKIRNIASFYVLNISCPNAFGGQPFNDPKLFLMLMKEVHKLNLTKPILVKMSPDLSNENVDEIIRISRIYGVAGFICSNLTKKNIPFEKGGISGKYLEKKSDELLKYVYKKTKGEFVLIGVGGIFSAEDAYRKIRLGANLVSLVTGMIYQGPALIGEINHGLVGLLKKDGFKNIGEAVGIDVK